MSRHSTVEEGKGAACHDLNTSIESEKTMIIALTVLAALLAIALIFSRVKKVAPVSWGWYGAVNQTSGLALGGYDPVAYQLAGKGFTANVEPTAWHVEKQQIFLFADDKIKADWLTQLDARVVDQSQASWATHPQASSQPQ